MSRIAGVHADTLAIWLKAHHAHPGDSEPWCSPLWDFLRLVKCHPDPATKAPAQAFRAVNQILESWRKQLPASRRREDLWVVWLMVPREEAEVEFCAAWDKVRFLPGREPLEIALEWLRRKPLGIREELRDRRPEGYQPFVSLAGWLQVAMGDRPILLPVKEVGNLLGVTPKTVSFYRRWAKEDGYLREVREHQRPQKDQEGRATEFRFDVDLYKSLRELAGRKGE